MSLADVRLNYVPTQSWTATITTRGDTFFSWHQRRLWVIVHLTNESSPKNWLLHYISLRAALEKAYQRRWNSPTHIVNHWHPCLTTANISLGCCRWSAPNSCYRSWWMCPTNQIVNFPSVTCWNRKHKLLRGEKKLLLTGGHDVGGDLLIAMLLLLWMGWALLTVSWGDRYGWANSRPTGLLLTTRVGCHTIMEWRVVVVRAE